MNRVFIVTGANGHLGNTIIKKLLEKGETVRGLVLPMDEPRALQELDIQLFTGDICDLGSLEPLFAVSEPSETMVIHTAGIVSIASKHEQRVHDVNVGGTANVVKMCLKHRVKRLVYVSSVHAIPEEEAGQVITEVGHFDKGVIGLYARTKAEASQLVLDSVKEGLDAVIVHPSGIIGPGDYVGGHTTQLIMDYLEGRLTACVEGGYDFVDVRDVADGILAAVDRGRCGEAYILSGRYVTVKELLGLLAQISGRRKITTVLPMFFAKLTAPLSELYYQILRQPPLYTRYSLYTLGSNSNFSHDKASKELGYAPRDMVETLKDTIKWLVQSGRVKRYSPKTTTA